MGLEIVDLNRDHIIDIFPRRRGDALLYDLNEIMRQSGNAYYHGKAYAAIDPDKNLTIAAGGVFYSHDKVGNAWILGTDDIRFYTREFSEKMNEMLPKLFNEMDLTRLQCDVLVTKPTWIKWTKSFGFKEEGILRKFRGNNDSMVLSIIREDLE